jgi:predicted dehydrogenase
MQADNAFRIHGEHGSIVIEGPFWGAHRALLMRARRPDRVAERPHRHNGFEYQIEEAMRCMRAGLVESPGISHAHSLWVLQSIDRMRESLGVRYPFEPAGLQGHASRS